MSWRVDRKPRGAAAYDEVIYVLTVADVQESFDIEYGDGSWDKLDEETRRKVINDATKYIEGFCGCGSYTWADAFRDSFGASVPGMKPVEE